MDYKGLKNAAGKWAIPENIRTHRWTAFRNSECMGGGGGWGSLNWNSEGMGGSLGCNSEGMGAFRSGISRRDRQECVP